MSEPLRIIVVEDTITYRMVLKKVIDGVPWAEVTGTASNGRLALDKLKREQFDLMLLDVEMPEMDGLTTLQHVSKEHPDLTVVMVSGTSRSNANIVMECLNAGALDFVTKPQESDATRALEALRKDLLPILEELHRKHQLRLTKPAAPVRRSPLPSRPVLPTATPAPLAAPSPARRQRPQQRPDLLLIGSSTGGPAALGRVLGGIKGKLPIPALIVQHMPPVFTASLAAQLTRSTGHEVVEAHEGLELQPGRVIIAMGGMHMALKNQDGQLKVHLNDGPKVNECRPAVDVLFMSAAATQRNSILTVILTGMGKDGANGVNALKRMGNTYCITQDKESCVVYGMPRAVDEMGLSDESLALDLIGPRIHDLCNS